MPDLSAELTVINFLYKYEERGEYYSFFYDVFFENEENLLNDPEFSEYLRDLLLFLSDPNNINVKSYIRHLFKIAKMYDVEFDHLNLIKTEREIFEKMVSEKNSNLAERLSPINKLDIKISSLRKLEKLKDSAGIYPEIKNLNPIYLALDGYNATPDDYSLFHYMCFERKENVKGNTSARNIEEIIRYTSDPHKIEVACYIFKLYQRAKKYAVTFDPLNLITTEKQILISISKSVKGDGQYIRNLELKIANLSKLEAIKLENKVVYCNLIFMLLVKNIMEEEEDTTMLGNLKDFYKKMTAKQMLFNASLYKRNRSNIALNLLFTQSDIDDTHYINLCIELIKLFKYYASKPKIHSFFDTLAALYIDKLEDWCAYLGIDIENIDICTLEDNIITKYYNDRETPIDIKTKQNKLQFFLMINADSQHVLLFKAKAQNAEAEKEKEAKLSLSLKGMPEEQHCLEGRKKFKPE